MSLSNDVPDDSILSSQRSVSVDVDNKLATQRRNVFQSLDGQTDGASVHNAVALLGQ